ncbi:uncharacterized protein C05D11.1-like [Diprion similis]|uniref:uncharacterized protein C05D11.1-like n=1 Tax=Diprion similis TaxID=362088 RepID=UPI001EF80ACE|nr:uncharacterized protein C05D11.1-like [Diprion similis]XP_046735683.1 uncharacterized protein C05D11.1-like [Diprion similis]
MAPVDSSPASNMAGFELICSLKSNDLIPVHKYKSSNTGLTVVIAEVDGPVVNGYFCLATEAYDDDGLPHTLEHLIFLGSEKYPYKGVLDLLANRCLASGTNAWTDTDHTCYTMTTAGSEGFLSLMPIFLEHILYPTLTDSGFITEVHHVTGEGEDAGVVYCEMQGGENSGESLVHNALTRAIYPGRCGYKSETGGMMKNLRESTNNDKVRKYHKEFYRPENLTVIITGQVKHADVFKAVQPLEQKIISKGDRGPYVRPWQSPVPPLTESIDLDIHYPCDDEDNGLINIGWRGPSAVTELYQLTGCSILLKYLTDNSVSPLQREFVEINDPYASKVAYSLAENSEAMLYLIFENVPKAKIPLVKDHLVKTLKDIADGENGIDMKRLNTVIQRHILETLSNLENSPHDSVAFMVIGDILYGQSKEDLDHRLNQIEDLKKLGKEPASYWHNILKKYFIEGPMVVVKGFPSQEKQLEIGKSERQRVEQQIEALGPEGLKKKAQELQEAMTLNERPIPDEMLTCVPIPSTDSINFHHIKNFTSDTAEQHPKLNLNNLPLFTYLDHVNTNFVYMSVIMDSAGIPRELRPYLPLLLEAILESPIKRGDTLIPYEQVVAELEADTIATSIGIGFDGTSRFSCGAYSHSVNFMLQLEPTKYEKGIQWIRELLYETELTPERLRIIAAKIVNEVAQVKRKGNKVVGDLMKGLIYSKDSNHFSSSMLRQHKFLTEVIERLNNSATQDEVLKEIESVRKTLTTSENMVFHMAVNVDKLAGHVSNIYQPWEVLLPQGNNPSKSKLRVTQDWALMIPPADEPANSCVTGLGCIESAFFCQCSPCIKDFLSPDLVPLLVFLQYLTQLEGPMWRQIRGQGLSYGYSVLPHLNEGFLYLTFYRATNVLAAYKEAKTIMESHFEGGKWEQALFESAKSSLIFEVIERHKSVGDVVAQSLFSYLKNVPHDYDRRMVQHISAVTIEDINSVGPKYVKQLFDPKECKTTIVCHPSKATEVAEGFEELGHNLKVYNSLEESYLNVW